MKNGVAVDGRSSAKVKQSPADEVPIQLLPADCPEGNSMICCKLQNKGSAKLALFAP
jgi:hypothetical protein